MCDRRIIASDPVIAAEKEAQQLCNRNVRLREPHEATVNLTAKLDLLDAKYLNATITHLAGILHQKPEYEEVALDVLRSKALGSWPTPPSLWR